MKKLLAFSILGLFSLTGPAFADLRAGNIIVNQNAPTPSGTNIRVTLTNDGDHSENVSRVELQARDGGTDDWHTVKTWSRPMAVEPHSHTALDYFPASDGSMDPTLTRTSYDLRVTATKADGDTVTSAGRVIESAER